MKTTVEMARLIEMLNESKIPYELTEKCGYAQVWYPKKGKEHICDVISHPYSYGFRDGLLEMMGLCDNDFDEVEGYLIADEVFSRIKKHYKKEDEIKYCPTCGFDCPYYKGTDICTLDNPEENCDEYAWYAHNDGEEEDQFY